MSFKTLIIRYEDLRDNTNEEFRKILNFIEDLKGTNKTINEEKMINSINSTNFSNLKNKEKLYGFGESAVSKDGKLINFFNLGFKNRWEKLLPKEMSDKIKDLGMLKNIGSDAKVYFDSGVKLNLTPDYLELYFPIFSSNGFSLTQPRFATKIRFILYPGFKTLTSLFTRKWF